jgi:molecular chaperone DnaK
MSKKKNVVGIDLGTSFSSIARLDSHGRPVVLQNAEGEQMTPSVVYFGDEGVIVGSEALHSGSDDPERLIENSKRQLGTGFLGWEIDEVFYSPVDIAAYLLGKLKNDAEEQIGEIDGAVISVPVHFGIQQRELTIEAAKNAGLHVLGLVNEPVAAGLTFILGENGLAYVSLADEQTILVYDLGGGTFDLSIVHYSEAGIEVKAATGDMKLGGIDWNARLIDIIAQRFWDLRGYDVRRDAKMLRKLSENIETAKRSLSNPNKSAANVTIAYEGYKESFKVTRDEFEKATPDLVEKTRVLTEGLVKGSVGRWDKLQQVLPVGGATRMPMIRECIRKMCLKTMGEVFGLEPNYRLSPDLAIAQGAALYAGLLAGLGPTDTTWAKQTYLPKMVSARGLGMAVRNRDGARVNHILIPANSALPASVTVGVETIRQDQQRIALKIVEAEDEHFRPEDVLLRCEIANLPANLPEGSAFDVTMTYEPSGLLQVTAVHRDSGRIATAMLKRDAAVPAETVGATTGGERTATEAPAVETPEFEELPLDTLEEEPEPQPLPELEPSSEEAAFLETLDLELTESIAPLPLDDIPLVAERAPEPVDLVAPEPDSPHEDILTPPRELTEAHFEPPTPVVADHTWAGHEDIPAAPALVDEPTLAPMSAAPPAPIEVTPVPIPAVAAAPPARVEELPPVPVEEEPLELEPIELELAEEPLELEAIEELEPEPKPAPLPLDADAPIPLDEAFSLDDFEPEPPPLPRKKPEPPPKKKAKASAEPPLPLD